MLYREERVYAVYILASKRNVTLHNGITNDLISRTQQHRSGEVPRARRNMASTLVWYVWFGDVAAARDLSPESMDCDPETGVPQIDMTH